MTEQTRILMYSDTTAAYVMETIFNTEYTEIIYVKRFSDFVNCLLNIAFDLILIDIEKIGEYQQIGNLSTSQNAGTPVITVSLKRAFEETTAPSSSADDVTTAEKQEADKKAGIKYEAVLDIDDKLKINPNSRRVTFDDMEIHLTKTEFDILYCFATHYDQVLSYEQILAYVWGYGEAIGDEVVKAHLRRLRQKLAVTGREYINNVRGKGYRFP